MADWLSGALSGALEAAKDQLKELEDEASKIINTAQVEFNFDDMAKEEEEEEKLAELYYDSDNVDGNDGIEDEVIHEELTVFEERREETHNNNIPNQKTTTKSMMNRANSLPGNVNAIIDKSKGKKVVQLLDVSGFDFDEDENEDNKPMAQSHNSSAVDVVGVVGTAVAVGAMHTGDEKSSTLPRHNINNNNKNADISFDDWDDEATPSSSHIHRPSSDTATSNTSVNVTTTTTTTTRSSDDTDGTVSQPLDGMTTTLPTTQTPPAVATTTTTKGLSKSLQKPTVASKVSSSHVVMNNKSTNMKSSSASTDTTQHAVDAGSSSIYQSNHPNNHHNNDNDNDTNYSSSSHPGVGDTESIYTGESHRINSTSSGSGTSSSGQSSSSGGKTASGGTIYVAATTPSENTNNTATPSSSSSQASPASRNNNSKAMVAAQLQQQQQLHLHNKRMPKKKKRQSGGDKSGLVAMNKSNPNPQKSHQNKIQMMLTTYNFSFDEGGGYMMEDHPEGDNKHDINQNKAKTDEENQLDHLNIGGGRDHPSGPHPPDIFDLCAASSLACFRMLWTHTKTLIACLSAAFQDLQIALGTPPPPPGGIPVTRGLHNSGSVSNPLACLPTCCIEHPIFNHPFFSHPIVRACTAYGKSLIHPDTRVQRWLDLWDSLSSVYGITTLTVLLFLYSYYKFGRIVKAIGK